MTAYQQPGKKQRMGDPDLGYVLDKAREMMNRDNRQVSTATEDRRFRELFGCGPIVALTLWNLIMVETMVPGSTVVHMLWALMLMKTYAKETTLCSLAGGVDEKTFRDWSWPLVRAIADLEPLIVSTGVNALMLTTIANIQ
jgi:hypothetical protein